MHAVNQDLVLAGVMYSRHVVQHHGRWVQALAIHAASYVNHEEIRRCMDFYFSIHACCSVSLVIVLPLATLWATRTLLHVDVITK